MKKKKFKLHWQILASLGLGAVISAVLISTDQVHSAGAVRLVAACNFVGDLFLNALKMTVVPLTASSIICGIIGVGSSKDFGRMGVKSILYYVASTFVAVCVGLVCVNLFGPGRVSPQLAQNLLQQATVAVPKAHSVSSADFLQIFNRMIPSNLVQAASDNAQILGIICFSLLFGFFASRLEGVYRLQQEQFWRGILQVMMRIANLAISFAPIGVFALVTPKLLTTGIAVIIPLSQFFASVLFALFFHSAIVLSLVLYAFKVSPWSHYKAMSPALLTAFSTASSLSSLPIAMECVENRAGISNRVASFTVPLGLNLNMNGSALYECTVVLFIAQLYGVVNPGFSLTFADQVMVVLLSMVTSVGVTGIPSASLVALTVVLSAMGLPLEYLGIVMVVDRLLDMCRTAVNLYSDTVAAVVVACSEGERPRYREEG